MLGGVDNTKPEYATMRQKLLALMAACESHVYGNMYAYFDPKIAGQIGQNPTQTTFTQAVTASMTQSVVRIEDSLCESEHWP